MRKTGLAITVLAVPLLLAAIFLVLGAGSEMKLGLADPQTDGWLALGFALLMIVIGENLIGFANRSNSEATAQKKNA